MDWLTCAEQYSCARLPILSGDHRSASWVYPDLERVDALDGEACRSFQLVRISGQVHLVMGKSVLLAQEDFVWLHGRHTGFLFFNYRGRIMNVASVFRWVWG